MDSGFFKQSHYVVGAGWIVLMLLFHTHAQEIVLSKDTCTLQTDIGSSVESDTIVISSTGTGQVTLDSALISFVGIDTTRVIPTDQLYIGFVEITGAEPSQRKNIIWLLDSVGGNEFRCVQESTSDTVRQPLTFGTAGDSVVLTWIIIGTCYWCDAIHFFPFFEAVLRMHFSNGETVELHFVYENLRVPVWMKRAHSRHDFGKDRRTSGFLINGCRVPDKILLDSRKRLRHIIYRMDYRR
jgi:hypothetical protein